jgi:hypothetical protein
MPVTLMLHCTLWINHIIWFTKKKPEFWSFCLAFKKHNLRSSANERKSTNWCIPGVMYFQKHCCSPTGISLSLKFNSQCIFFVAEGQDLSRILGLTLFHFSTSYILYSARNVFFIKLKKIEKSLKKRRGHVVNMKRHQKPVLGRIWPINRKTEVTTVCIVLICWLYTTTKLYLYQSMLRYADDIVDV